MSDLVTRPWLGFRGSDMQRIIHDELTKQIEDGRTRLETCIPEELVAIQQSIKVRRSLLEYIHQHDTQDIKKTYGR